MNNLVDPVKILICGGYAVGKSSIARRLAAFSLPGDYTPTSGVNVIEFVAHLKNSASIKVTLVDVGAELIHKQGNKSFLSVLTMDTEGAMIVLDRGKLQSMKEADMWLEFLAKSINKQIVKHALVHKADLPSNLQEINVSSLDLFIQRTDIDDWWLTVGHPDLADVDMSRGHFIHQKPPEDILSKIVISVLLRRQSNFCKLVPVPFRIEYQRWYTYDLNDLDKFVNSYTCSEP